MEKVECLSETLNTTLVNIQTELKGQQVEILRLSSENVEQKSKIKHLETENEQQQILLDEQKENIDHLISDNDSQQNEIQLLAIENGEQGAQLAEHQLDIVKFTNQHFYA